MTDCTFTSKRKMFAAIRNERTRHQAVPKTPRRIQHVVFDADDTIWRINPWGLASRCRPVGTTTGDSLPLRCSDSLGRSQDGTATLDHGLRDTLRKMADSGIRVSIASQNDPESVTALLDAFGLRHLFSFIEAGWTSKADMIHRIEGASSTPADAIMFVDDLAANVVDVEEEGVLALQIGPGGDISEISSIFRFMR